MFGVDYRLRLSNKQIISLSLLDDDATTNLQTYLLTQLVFLLMEGGFDGILTFAGRDYSAMRELTVVMFTFRAYHVTGLEASRYIE